MSFLQKDYQIENKGLQPVVIMILTFILFLGIGYGKWSRYPLRWSDAFYSTNHIANQLAINPILYFLNTYLWRAESYDIDNVKKYYPFIAKHLGIDNINDYYDQDLKYSRLNILKSYDNFKFKKLDISEMEELKITFKSFNPQKVVNLAAQPGVRNSLTNSSLYITSNIVGFMNIIELCKTFSVNGLIYASSSSVYGKNIKTPFSVDDRVDTPISLYAATKKSNELIAYSYSHLYKLNTTGLRFFSVYGPYGRPDMAYYLFTDKISNNKVISVFNNGKMKRDFTYIDDIINGIERAIIKNYKCEIFNLGNNKNYSLMNLINIIEKKLGKKAQIKFYPKQPGDVTETYANINKSKKMLNYNPNTRLDKGIESFINWYTKYK